MSSQQRRLSSSQPASSKPPAWCASHSKDHPDRWYFCPDKNGTSFQNPSLLADVDEYTEQWYRLQCAELMNSIGRKIILFYQFHSMKRFHRNTMAPVFIFLAAKVDESPRRVQDVISVTYKLLNPDPNAEQLQPDTAKYQQELDDVFTHENVLLQTLAFDLIADHPHHIVIKCCQQVLRCEKALSVAAYAIANCTLQYTSLCVKYPPAAVAAMCIHMASQWSSIALSLLPNPVPLWKNDAIPLSLEGKAWYSYIDATLTIDLIDKVMKEFMDTVEKYPPRILDKIRLEVLGKAQCSSSSAAVTTGGSSGSTSRTQHTQIRTEAGSSSAPRTGSNLTTTAAVKTVQGPTLVKIKPPAPPTGRPPTAPQPPPASSCLPTDLVPKTSTLPAPAKMSSYSSDSGSEVLDGRKPPTGSNMPTRVKVEIFQSGSTHFSQKTDKRIPEASVSSSTVHSSSVSRMRINSSHSSSIVLTQKRVMDNVATIELVDKPSDSVTTSTRSDSDKTGSAVYSQSSHRGLKRSPDDGAFGGSSSPLTETTPAPVKRYKRNSNTTRIQLGNLPSVVVSSSV